MRTPLLAALLAATALAVAGCGSDDDRGATAAAPVTGASASFPVTVEHKFGRTTVPAEPERVVVVGYTEQDTVLALGVEPVAVREFLGGYDWRKRPWAPVGDVPKALPSEELNFEAIAAARPDLIVGINSGMTKADFRRLSKIAPTIGQSGKYVDYGMPWQEQTLLVGRALGREAKAKELVQDVEAKFAAARAAHPEFARATAILAYGGPDGYGAYTTQDTRSRFLTDLGFTTAEEIDRIAGKSFYTELSQERFRLIDRDLVVMFGPRAEIEDNAVFRRLKAVEEDRIIYLDLADQFAGALGFSSVLSLPWLLDNELAQLAAAVDGDPATKVVQPR